MISENNKNAVKNMALFLFLGTFLWGTSFFCIKIALREYSVFQVVFLRVAIAFFILQLFLRKSPSKKTKLPDYFHYSVLSLLTLSLPFLCINFASQFLTTGVAAILNSLASFATFALVAILGLAKGKLKAPHILGLILGIAGVFLIISRGDVSFSQQNFLPEILIISASFIYASGTLYKDQFLKKKDSFLTARYTMLFATLCIGIFLLASGEGLFFPKTTTVWIAVLWLGAACTALASVIFFHLIEEWGPSRTSTVSYVIPLSAYGIGVFALGEPFLWQPIFGGMFIAMALFLTRTYR